MGHPVLLWLVLEYSLAMVDCHRQPYQGVFARQGSHCQSPVLKRWTQKNAQSPLAQFCWFVHLQGYFVWGFCVMLGFSCAPPTPPELLLPPSFDEVKTSSSFPSSVTWAKRWIAQHSNSSVNSPLGND